MGNIKVSSSSRLKELMNERNLKQVDIINKCKPICDRTIFGNDKKVQITKSDLSQWLSGKYEPGQWKLTILSEAFNVNPAWLMGYDVPMEKIKESKNFSKDEALHKKIDNLTEDQKEIINNMIDTMKKETNNN
nr:MAG TPA: bifunctional HTH-domain containing protein/aminotransferase [Caudoviricetes sp.]